MDTLNLFMTRLSDNDDDSMTDMMIDVETTGTNPAHGAVIQLAGIKFNYSTGKIGKPFNQSLQMAPGRFWDEDTRRWWGEQKPSILQGIITRAQPPQDVMKAFLQYASEGAPRGGYRFWSKPLSFDWGFVAGYCAQYGYPMPFQFWRARDLRSFIAGLRGLDAENVNMDHVVLSGDAHNALYDCAYQIKQLFAAKNNDWGEIDIEHQAA